MARKKKDPSRTSTEARKSEGGETLKRGLLLYIHHNTIFCGGQSTTRRFFVTVSLQLDFFLLNLATDFVRHHKTAPLGTVLFDINHSSFLD